MTTRPRTSAPKRPAAAAPPADHRCWRCGAELEPPPCPRLAATPVFGPLRGRWLLIDVESDLVYCFSGAAARPGAPDGLEASVRFQPATIYARTRSAGVTRTGYRSVDALERRLGPTFLRIEQGVLANSAHCEVIDPRGRLLRVTVARSDPAGPGSAGEPRAEWLVVSRGAMPFVRERLGLPVRRRPRRSPARRTPGSCAEA